MHKLHWGYLPDAEEFRRLVAGRELLHQLSLRAGDTLRVWLDMILQDLDARFLSVTSCRHDEERDDGPCWVCRIPSAADDEWRQHLERIWGTVPPTAA